MTKRDTKLGIAGATLAALLASHTIFSTVIAAPGFDFHRLTPPSLPVLRIQAQEVTTMQDVQRYLQREGLYDGALDGRWGPRTEQGLIGLWEHGTAVYADGDYAKAVQIWQVIVLGAELGWGREHQDTLSALNNLAVSLWDQGRPVEAEAIQRRLLAVQERVLGAEHPETLATLNNLALSIADQGRPAEAEEIQRRLLAVRERVLGEEHPDTLRTLNNLALSLRDQGRPAEAEAIQRRLLAVQERVLGEEHPETLATLSNLAVSIADQGRPAEAEAIQRRLLVVRERVLGADHPDTLGTLGGLASSLKDQGKYAEAEAIERRLVGAWERALGADHPEMLATLNNLANSIRLQGRYAEAEAIQRRLLSVQYRTLGTEHQHTMITLYNLSLSYQDQGKYEEAETTQRRLLSIQERVLGAEHPNTLFTLGGLATSVRDQGRPAEAEAIQRRLLAVLERVLGAEHPSTLHALYNLANSLWDQGRFSEGEVILRRLLPVWERVLGEEHPDTLRTLNNLAGNLGVQGKYAEATAIVEQGFLALPGYFALGGSAGVETQAQQLPLDLDGYLANLARLEGPDVPARSFTAQGWLAFGPLDFTLGDVTARQSVSEGAGAAALRAYQEARERLQGARGAYLASFEEGGNEAARSSIAARVDTAEDAFEAAQARLSRDFPELADLTLPQPLTAAEAQALLVPGEALVAYAFTDGMLHAWLVTPDAVSWERIEVDEAEVAGMVRRLRQSLDFQVEAPDVPMDGCALESIVSDLSDRPFDACLAHELHDLVLGRFDLSGVESLIVVPDGPLETLPFSVLVSEPPVGGTPRWLITDHPIAVLPTTSSLRALRRASAAGSTSDRKPYFGIAPVEFGTVGDGAIRRDALVSLPGTRDEVERLAAILGAGPADAVVGAAATESFVKSARLSDYRVLSFATHGLLTREAEALSGGLLTEPALALALSGDGEDGFLTASEAAGLRLDADWVLLSACNTAAGDGEDAEGLSGLARAFFFAGADALLVSHWSVDDASAQDLMARTMERAAREPDLGKAQALRDAMLALQAAPDTAHPFFWAPFDLVGDNR